MQQIYLISLQGGSKKVICILGFQQSWTIYAYVAKITNRSKATYSMLHTVMGRHRHN